MSWECRRATERRGAADSEHGSRPHVSQAGLTQKQLAERGGFSRPRVSAWETDKDFPSRRQLPNIARALECDPNVLLEAYMSALFPIRRHDGRMVEQSFGTNP